MALSTFSDGSYLELIAAQPKADPVALMHHEWSAQIQGNAGPGAWAARVADIGVERSRLQAAGVQVSELEKSGRARPDGFQLKWETAQVGSATRGTFFPFLIRDFTPREQRTGKALNNGILGVSRVVIAVRDLQASIARFRKAYGWPEPLFVDDPAFGGRVAVFADTPVALTAPHDESSWVSTRLEQFGEGPCGIVFRASAKNPLKKELGELVARKSPERPMRYPVGWLKVGSVAPGAIPWHLGIE